MEVSLNELYSNMSKYQLEETDHISSDNSGDNSPSSTTFNASISSPKRSRRAIQKKVVTFPLKEMEGSRFKGDCTPPSDSWAWRKYGQKPIKGSPYPRGYYRCSSSKGCPARKQVERSRTDPNTLVVTYSYEHNHAWPISRNNHHNRHTPTTTIPTTLPSSSPSTVVGPTINHDHPKPDQIQNTTTQCSSSSSDHQSILFPQSDHNDGMIPPSDHDLTWLSSDNHILENNSFFTSFTDLDYVAKIFPMREEDESLFADLGELPECSVVFRKAANVVAGQTWCGTTG